MTALPEEALRLVLWLLTTPYTPGPVWCVYFVFLQLSLPPGIHQEQLRNWRIHGSDKSELKKPLRNDG